MITKYKFSSLRKNLGLFFLHGMESLILLTTPKLSRAVFEAFQFK